MKCFFHENIDAVATCQTCGKALCKACASQYTPCACPECFQQNQENAVRRHKKDKADALIDTNAELIGAIVKGLICAVVLTLIFNAIGSTPTPIGLSIMFFFVPFGWAVITYVEQWLPGLLMSGVIFLFYIAIKLGLSMALGIPCFLYQIIKYIVRLVKNLNS